MITALLVGLNLLLLITLPFLINRLAERDFFFTKVDERTAVEVQAGDRFHHFILAYHGHVLVKNDAGVPSIVTPLSKVSPATSVVLTMTAIVNPLRLLEKLGIYWVGIPAFYKVGEYRFKWSEPNPKDGKLTRWNRDEPTRSLYVNQFTYFPLIQHAFTKGNMPVDVSYLLVVQIEDLYKARYGTEDWYAYVTGETNAIGREYIGGEEFNTLVAESESAGGQQPRSSAPKRKAFRAAIMNADILKEIRGRSGVRIVDAKIEEVCLSNEDQHKDFVNALAAKFIAEQEAEVDIARAKGHAVAADSEVKRINKVYSAINAQPNGVQIRQLEALEKTADKGNGTNWVIGSSIGGVVSSVLRSAPSTLPEPLEK